jgi:hypothetical protein
VEIRKGVKMFDFSIEVVMQEFVKSTHELAEASRLTDDDPIKQGMISHIYPQFDKIIGRTEKLKFLISNDANYYIDNKDFIKEEFAKITFENRSLVKEIKKILGGLN